MLRGETSWAKPGSSLLGMWTVLQGMVSLKSVCSALDRCINSSISGFSKKCIYQVTCCQNNKSDAWFAGNNTGSHWLSYPIHRKVLFLYRTVFLSAGKNINSFSILCGRLVLILKRCLVIELHEGRFMLSSIFHVIFLFLKYMGPHYHLSPAHPLSTLRWVLTF